MVYVCECRESFSVGWIYFFMFATWTFSHYHFIGVMHKLPFSVILIIAAKINIKIMAILQPPIAAEQRKQR